jgi:TonB family protein
MNRFMGMFYFVMLLAVPGIFAECHHVSVDEGATASATTPASTFQHAAEGVEDQRTVLVELVLKKSGAVRDATALSGPTTLRPAAIDAARRRKYKAMHSPTAPKMMVAVTFARDKNTVTEIKEAMFGVPGCVPAGAAVRVSQNVMNTRLLSRVDPVYPSEARAQHIEGIVVLRLRIDKDGNVYNAEKVSGPDALVPAASAAVKQWKYQPYVLNGTSAEVETTVDLRFPLQ